MHQNVSASIMFNVSSGNSVRLIFSTSISVKQQKQSKQVSDKILRLFFFFHHQTVFMENSQKEYQNNHLEPSNLLCSPWE